MQATDAELVQLTRTGDMVAFGELIRRYQGLIYGVAYHQVGNFTDAQDIAQEVFVKAFRCLHQLEQPERFAPWLKTVAANECKMWLRGSRLAIPLEEAELMPSYMSLAVESWRRRERQTEIRQAVASLPERSRLMLTLHYLSGLSHREIGEFLGIAANAVSQHLYRARQQLKEMLMAEIEEGYAMNRLPESFTQEVLGRVTLYPMIEEQFITAQGEGDVRGFMMGVGERGPEETFITLWMRQDDLDDIVLGTPPSRSAEKPKGRAFESAIGILNAFGIEIRQVVLRLSDAGQCRANVDLKQGDTQVTVDMRPSDALGLAVRVRAPIFAEEPVVRQGNVGEDDVPTPQAPIDSDEFKTSLQMCHQVYLLRDKAWEIGLSPEDLVDTIHYRKNDAEGTLRIWIEAIPDRELTLSLEEYGAGVERLFGHARDRQKEEFVRGRKRYHVYYSLLDEDARIRIVPAEADAQPESVPWPAGTLDKSG